MSNVDPSLPSLTSLTTEQIQKYLEENKQLILAILEGQNLGKSSEVAQCQARLQHNLTFLAKLADAQPQAQPHSQLPTQTGQGTQHPHVAMSQQQPDRATLPLDMRDQQQQQHHLAMSQQQPDRATLPFDMRDQQQQQQQHHLAMSLQQPDRATLPFDMRDQQQQQQHHLAMSLQQPDVSTSKLPFQMSDQQQHQHKQAAFFQPQLLMPGQMNRFPGTNSGINQASQARLGINLSGKPESNQIGLDAGGSLGKSPLGRSTGNTRP